MTRSGEKLACPSCGALVSRVLPMHMRLRELLAGGYWRRRRCEGCASVFVTREIVVMIQECKGLQSEAPQ